jgi:hypothetical protein
MMVVLLLSGARVGRCEFPDMLRRVPQDANAIVFIDVERLLASPMAKEGKWKEKRSEEFANQPMSLPPTATKLVRAAHVNMDSGESAWQIAVIEAAKLRTLEALAERENGYVDTVAGTKAAWSPRGAYAIRLANNTVGLMFPANRQHLARWIKERPGTLAPYLAKAWDEMGASGPQMVVALDLEELVDPQDVSERLKTKESLQGSKVDLKELAATLATIKGVKFSVTIRDKATGKITVDLGKDASPLKDVGKPLLMEVLQDRGLALGDIEGWKSSVSRSAFAVEGDLSRSSLLRLSSVFEFPSLPLDESGRDEETVDAGDPKLYATQSHYKAVVSLLNDLNEKRSEFQNPGHAAGWWETYAKRVSRLPVQNVDPDMLEYSARISELLRDGAEVGRSTGIREGVRRAQDSASGVTSGRLYDQSGNRLSAARRRAISAEERGAGATKGGEIRAEIQKETEAIRRMMTERYKVQF